MAPRILRIPVAVCLIVPLALLGAGAPTHRVRAEGFPPSSPALPSLTEFSRIVTNGEAEVLRGAYAPGVFAHPVVQQPTGDPTFVTPRQGFLTQFSSALSAGSTGLLAHNFLAGANFSLLENDQVIYLIYGAGGVHPYSVTGVYRFRATQPGSVYSDFVDLSGGARSSASTILARMYGRRGALVLQTCIAAEGSPTWGRLFVVAEPSAAPVRWKPLRAASPWRIGRTTVKS